MIGHRFFITIIAFFALWGAAARATDANTNCDKACYVEDKGKILGVPYDYSYMDYACRSRCLVEKEIAKKTGITSCDIWRYNSTTVAGFYASTKAIEEANRRGIIRSEHACQARVDEAAGGASAIGAAKEVYTNGLRIAGYLKDLSVVGFVVSEGAKHFAHCACAGAKYRDVTGTDENGNVSVNASHFFISMTRGDGAWAERHGKAANREEMIAKVKEALKNHWSKSRLGYVNANGPTTAHAICKNRVFYKTGTGGESLTRAYQFALDNHLTHCLFDLENGTDNSDVLNRFSQSVWNNNGRWAVQSGAGNDQQNVTNKAKTALGAPVDGSEASLYSSSRLTQTRLTCHVSSTSSGGLSTSEDVVALYGGAGSLSLQRAIKAAQDNHWGKCKFDLHDVAF